MNVAIKNLYKEGYLQKQDKKYYKMKTIFGVPTKCYVFFCDRKENSRYVHSKEPVKPTKEPPEITAEQLEQCRVKIPDEELAF